MTKTLLMGEFDIVRSPDSLKTSVGSCVALVLYDPELDVFGLAHIMLPKAAKADRANLGKYADTAIPALIAKMGTPPDQVGRLRAKAAGGANMFSSIPTSTETDILKVGERNIEATLEFVRGKGIRILGTALGGTRGIELTVDAQSGKIWVKPIGAEAREL